VATTDAVTENVNQKALSSIEDSKRKEDETLKERHHIPCKIMTLSMEQLVDELQTS
jgi:hypothetical protein